MTERTHLLDQPKMVFEGTPCHGWRADSLPPAAVPYKPTYVYTPPLYGGANRELPEDVLDMTTAQAIQTLVERGWRNVDIANSLNVDDTRVSMVKNRYKKQRSEAPAPATATPAIHRELPRPNYVLDWSARMAAWRFEDDYVKPRLRRRHKALVHERHAIGQRWLGTATEINSRPPASKSPLFK